MDPGLEDCNWHHEMTESENAKSDDDSDSESESSLEDVAIGPVSRGISWRKYAGSSLSADYGTGSRMINFNNKRKADELTEAAETSRNIVAL